MSEKIKCPKCKKKMIDTGAGWVCYKCRVSKDKKQMCWICQCKPCNGKQVMDFHKMVDTPRDVCDDCYLAVKHGAYYRYSIIENNRGVKN